MSTPQKTGAVIVMVGRQHAGKTPFIKKMMDAGNFRSNVVLDVRREYDAERFTIFYNFATFKEYLPNIKGSFIVIEEATAFIASYKDLALTDMLIGVEHNKNTIVFVFHALGDVPPYVLRFCRYIILFETNDDPELIKQSKPRFYPYLAMPKSHDKPLIIDNYKPIKPSNHERRNNPDSGGNDPGNTGSAGRKTARNANTRTADEQHGRKRIS